MKVHSIAAYFTYPNPSVAVKLQTEGTRKVKLRKMGLTSSITATVVRWHAAIRRRETRKCDYSHARHSRVYQPPTCLNCLRSAVGSSEKARIRISETKVMHRRFTIIPTNSYCTKPTTAGVNGRSHMRCAGKNTKRLPAQRSNAQRMCERPLVLDGYRTCAIVCFVRAAATATAIVRVTRFWSDRCRLVSH